MSPKSALAGTLGMDYSDLSEYRYKSTRTSKAIYAIDDRYLCASSTKPTDVVGTPWELHGDQFWAERAHTKVWMSHVLSSLEDLP